MSSSLISGAGSILGGVTGGKGAAKAAKIQAQAYNNAIAEQRNEFNTIQSNEAPYMAVGQPALTALANLIGTNGNSAQQTAISGLQSSPLYTGQYQNGVDTILANAAATGGLRGGNTENSLANFGSTLLGNVYQQQLGNLNTLVGIGQAGAAGTNAAATNAGNNISNLLTSQGSAAAKYALAQTANTQNIIQGLGSILGGSGNSDLLSMFG